MIHIDNEQELFSKGFTEALVGNCARTFKGVYSLSAMVDVLLLSQNMSYEEAREYINSNIINIEANQYTPIYLNDIDFY